MTHPSSTQRPNDVPEVDFPTPEDHPTPDTLPDPMPDPAPIPAQDPDPQQPGEVTPPIYS